MTVDNSGHTQRNHAWFDPLGRLLYDSQTTIYDDVSGASKTYSFAYTYYLDGTLKTETYPSGKVVNHSYDGSGRPYSTWETGVNYVNSVDYADHGGIEQLQLGNLLYEQTCYNDRLQPTAMRLGTSVSSGCAVGTGYKLHLGFDFGAASTNNGNMLGQDITAAAGYVFEQTYTYDAVNRLASASEVKAGSGATWSRTYGYDHFGNRWISANTGDTLHMATPTSSAAIQATTNRLTGTGITYDAAGNLTAHPHITPGGSMGYDANNKMKTFDATGVDVDTWYDAAGRRVRKVYNGETTIWVYDGFGRLAAEYTTAASTMDEVVYRTTDHLGSTRAVSDALGEVVQRRDFFPFGESIPANSAHGDRGLVTDGGFATYNATLGMRQQFTGQQRDEETGLDYFWERCFCDVLARFFSVDPGSAGAEAVDPQSWNAFSYVGNNPLVYIDPDGAKKKYFYGISTSQLGSGALAAGPPKGFVFYNSFTFGNTAYANSQSASGGPVGAAIAFYSNLPINNWLRKPITKLQKRSKFREDCIEGLAGMSSKLDV